MNRQRKSETKARDGQAGRRIEGRAPATSLSEAAVGVLGFVLVLATIAFLVYQALTADEKIPSISVAVVTITPTSSGYLVRFRARNRGATAAAVRIRGELRRDSSTVERSEAILDYLPFSGEREGGLIFREDPNRYELRLAAEGYADP